LGNGWGLSIISFGQEWPRYYGRLASIVTIHCSTRLSLVFCVIEAFPWSLPCIATSPLMAVMTRRSRHLFLGRLREWDSLCCSFGTGLSVWRWRWSTDAELFR
jgi:hypothetical protein